MAPWVRYMTGFLSVGWVDVRFRPSASALPAGLSAGFPDASKAIPRGPASVAVSVRRQLGRIPEGGISRFGETTSRRDLHMNRSEPVPTPTFATRLRSKALTLAAPLAAGALTVAMAALPWRPPVEPKKASATPRARSRSPTRSAGSTTTPATATGRLRRQASSPATGPTSRSAWSCASSTWREFKRLPDQPDARAVPARRPTPCGAAGLKMIVRFAYTTSDGRVTTRR